MRSSESLSKTSGLLLLFSLILLTSNPLGFPLAEGHNFFDADISLRIFTEDRSTLLGIVTLHEVWSLATVGGEVQVAVGPQSVRSLVTEFHQDRLQPSLHNVTITVAGQVGEINFNGEQLTLDGSGEDSLFPIERPFTRIQPGLVQMRMELISLEGVLSNGLRFSHEEREELYNLVIDPEGAPEARVLTVDIYPEIPPFEPSLHPLLGELAALAEEVISLQEGLEIQKLAANTSDVAQNELRLRAENALTEANMLRIELRSLNLTTTDLDELVRDLEESRANLSAELREAEAERDKAEEMRNDNLVTTMSYGDSH